MMTRDEAIEYIDRTYYVDKMPDVEYQALLDTLMATPHRPWCRTRTAGFFTVYGVDCTCGEDGQPPTVY